MTVYYTWDYWLHPSSTILKTGSISILKGNGGEAATELLLTGPGQDCTYITAARDGIYSLSPVWHLGIFLRPGDRWKKRLCWSLGNLIILRNYIVNWLSAQVDLNNLNCNLNIPSWDLKYFESIMYGNVTFLCLLSEFYVILKFVIMILHELISFRILGFIFSSG